MTFQIITLRKEYVIVCNMHSDEPDTGHSSLIVESLKPITNKSRLNFHTDPQIHRILPAGPVLHHNQSNKPHVHLTW